MQPVVIRADARALPLPDASVDLVVTSPPYFALRSYTDGGEHYAGQIGSEATPGEYIAALIGCTREWLRVLKPSGSLWVDLGDKYGRGSRTTSDGTTAKRMSGDFRHAATGHDKSLMLLPERYRIACVDRLGLIARAVVVWSKPNGLPESVTDRVRRSHEDWVHLTKQPRYFSAVDEIREPHTWGRQINPDWAHTRAARTAALPNNKDWFASVNPLGKLLGSVWEIPSQPLTVPERLGVDHFAAFPTEWPRRIILGWSPSGICVECGEGRRPVADRVMDVLRAGAAVGRAHLNGESVHGRDRRAGTHVRSANTITGYACACPESTAPVRPAVVLDPFGGTGTTALVASVLGRVGISVDRSADYCRLAAWRTTDPGQIAAAMRVDKPEPVPEAQLSLLDELEDVA